MYFNELDTYYNECKEKGLVKMSVELVESSEIDATVITKTKETYEFECSDIEEDPVAEAAADELINMVRLSTGFVSAAKKFKKGKENRKTEEIKEYAKYIVVITLTH